MNNVKFWNNLKNFTIFISKLEGVSIKQFKTITIDTFSVIIFIAMSSNRLKHSKGMALTRNQAKGSRNFAKQIQGRLIRTKHLCLERQFKMYLQLV